MFQETSPISREALLIEANEVILNHDDYISGIKADSVEQKGGVLVFKGNYFLDEEGLPTAKTTVVFNLFKHLAHKYSKTYHLED